MIVRAKPGSVLSIRRNGSVSSATSNDRGCGFVIESMMSHAKSGSVWSARGSLGDGEAI